MKKTYTFLFALIGLFSAVFLTSCDKDEDKNELIGTTWVINAGDIGDRRWITFVSNTELTFQEETFPSERGTYIYNKPNIALTVSGETISGVVNGNIMIFQVYDEEERGSVTIIITKQ
jgi:hypothetical protein